MLQIMISLLTFYVLMAVSLFLGGEKNAPISYPSTAQVIPTTAPIMKTKILNNGSHIYQTYNNCGPASLSMVLSYYGINVSQQELGKALRPYQHVRGNNDDKSVTLREMAVKAEEYGLVAYYRPAGNTLLLQQFVDQEIPIITRTQLTLKEDIGHYRVVKGYDSTKNQLIQDDSLQGANLFYSYDDFNALWSGFNYEFLVVAPEDKRIQVEQILGPLVDERVAWETALTTANGISRSTALYYIGDFRGAIEVYEKISSTLPERTLWYQMEPLLAYYQDRNFDQVIKISDDILSHGNRAYAELYELRGKVFEQLNNHKAAQIEFEKARYYNTSDYWKENVTLFLSAD